MGTIDLVLGVVSLILSVPAIRMGQRRKKKALFIQGIIALVLGVVLVISGLNS